MDLVRLGLGIRALRRRRGWRQRDLAAAAGVSQALISLIERGHGDRVSVQVLIAVAAALDGRIIVQLRWRAGDLDRLLDADHALVSATFVGRLQTDGWETRVEVTYASSRSTGSIDILAWHPETRSLLVIEIKTEISSAEATLRKMDEKLRLAAGVARERLGWVAASVSNLLAIEDTPTNRRRVGASHALFGSALPMDGRAVRRWLSRPAGAIAGRLFLSPSNRGSAIQKRGGRQRVRRTAGPGERPDVSVARDEFQDADDPELHGRTILVG